MNKVLIGVISALALGGAFGGGWYWGQQSGKADGFAIGMRYGEAQAAKKAPVPVRNAEHEAALLAATPAFSALPLQDGELDALAAVANQAISPCPEGGQRGVSLASSLLEPTLSCGTVAAQLRLGLAALRTYGGGPEAVEEAVAVLRVERRVALPVQARHPYRGNPEAPVTLTVFTDFQCPYCARGEALVQSFLDKHGDRFRLELRHLPLVRIHPAAWPSALAAEAAAEQGKFWEMVDALYALGPKGLGKAMSEELSEGWSYGTWREALDEQGEGGPDGPTLSLPAGPVPFAEQAAGLGLDAGQFAASMRSPELWARVQSDLDLAEAVGASGTPSFFFDGRAVEERRSVGVFARLLDKAQAEADFRFSWGLEPPPRGATPPPALEPAPSPSDPSTP